MTSAEYGYDSATFKPTDQMTKDFEEHGYVMIRGLITKEELGKVRYALEGTDAITKHGYGIPDDEGRESKLVLWSHPGHDVTGMVARCEKLVGTCEKLIGGEVYHYHTKLMMKDPHVGGKHVWHQDYGYWYKNGCLFPDMLTVFIAVDSCKKANGCLQILRGSHKCGRIEHIMVGGQTGADMERVKEVEKKCPLEYVEMEPGDALFFHCNLLHTSSGNDSDHRRWAFLCAYNKASNDPVYEHHHPRYTPLKKVPDSAIMECKEFTDTSGKGFIDQHADKTVKLDKTN